MSKDLKSELRELSDSQRRQIEKQLRSHSHRSPYRLPMDGPLSAKIPEIIMLPDVLQPMSSRLLAEFLLENPNILRDKAVLDMGSGSGIQGLAAALGGAKSVDFSDICRNAFANTQENLSSFGLEEIGTPHLGDLFESLGDRRFDVVIFAHPYFGAKPLDEYPVSRGMLDDGALIRRFLEEAPRFLRSGHQILMPFMDFAGTTNDPSLRGAEVGYEVTKLLSRELLSGLQRGRFHIYQLALPIDGTGETKE